MWDIKTNRQFRPFADDLTPEERSQFKRIPASLDHLFFRYCGKVYHFTMFSLLEPGSVPGWDAIYMLSDSKGLLLKYDDTCHEIIIGTCEDKCNRKSRT